MKKLALTILLMFSVIAYGQQTAKHGPTKEDWVLLATHASFRALDVYSTHRVISMGGREQLLPSSIADHTPTMAAYSAGCVALDWFVTQELVKHHHSKIAHAITMIDIAQMAPRAVQNLFLEPPQKKYTRIRFGGNR